MLYVKENIGNNMLCYLLLLFGHKSKSPKINELLEVKLLVIHLLKYISPNYS